MRAELMSRHLISRSAGSIGPWQLAGKAQSRESAVAVPALGFMNNGEIAKWEGSL
jgi:hypothetical protein